MLRFSDGWSPAEEEGHFPKEMGRLILDKGWDMGAAGQKSTTDTHPSHYCHHQHHQLPAFNELPVWARF